MLQNLLKAFVVVLLLAGQSFGQGIQPVNPLSPSGSRLFPDAFSSADNIAAKTATFMHGGLMAWDSGGGNWDRLLLTSGSLHVNVQNASLAVTGTFWQATQPVSGTLTVIQGTGTNLHMVCDSGCSGSAGFADNSAFTFGTTAVNPIAGVLDDTTTNTATEDSAAVVRITAQKGLHANLRNNSGTEIGTAGAPIRTDPTGTTTQPISAASLPLPTGAATAANQDGIIRDGTGDTTQANVSGGRVHVDGSGVTQPISGTVTANIGTFPDNEPFNIAQWNGSAVQEASNGKNTTGAGLPAAAVVGQCDDTAPAALTENQFGHARINCTTHHQLVEVGAALPTGSNTIGGVTGTLADDGTAAATNRVGTLPAIAQSGYNSSTAGRNTAHNTGAGDGLLMAAVLPSTAIPSYSASAVVASAASATDIAVLPGNATNTVLVTEVRVSCTQTTAGTVQLHLIKRSTANTGGTSAGMTETPDDSAYSAAVSAALTYTGNPTTGTPVGDVDIIKLGCMATGTAAPNDVYIANYRQKPIVLRGTAQQLTVNLNGATVSGGSFAVTFKWLEVTGL